MVTYCSGVVSSVELERIRALSKSIEARLSRQARPQTKVLVLKHKTSSRSVEECLLAVFARDGKREGAVGPRKGQLSVVWVDTLGRGPWPD
jgi:hypothetical protein